MILETLTAPEAINSYGGACADNQDARVGSLVVSFVASASSTPWISFVTPKVYFQCTLRSATEVV